MSQPPIDLLPESIRARCLAGVRLGRVLAAIAAAIALLVIGATHVRFDLDRTRERLAQARERAELIMATEARIEETSSALAEIREFTDLHERLALPLEVSAVMATLTNELPPSVSLERIDLDAARRPARSGTSGRGSEGAATRTRVLAGEVSGFAASDEDVAEFVARLQDRQPFHAVSLDFSRTRSVRDQTAREFRVSFRIDLDRRYIVEDAGNPETLSAGDRGPQSRSTATGGDPIRVVRRMGTPVPSRRNASRPPGAGTPVGSKQTAEGR